MSEEVFLSIGANLGNPITTVLEVLEEIAALPNVSRCRRANLYETTPVSPIPQANYINTACSFLYSGTLKELWPELQKMEVRHGKVDKDKYAPRLIDIDVVFFGSRTYSTPIHVPHPRYMDRLFVLVPLRDLTNRVELEEESIEIDHLLTGSFQGQWIKALSIYEQTMEA